MLAGARASRGCVVLESVLSNVARFDTNVILNPIENQVCIAHTDRVDPQAPSEVAPYCVPVSRLIWRMWLSMHSRAASASCSSMARRMHL